MTHLRVTVISAVHAPPCNLILGVGIRASKNTSPTCNYSLSAGSLLLNYGLVSLKHRKLLLGVSDLQSARGIQKEGCFRLAGLVQENNTEFLIPKF